MMHLEMTPRRVERGRKPDRSQEHPGRSTAQSKQESSQSTSQKRWSQSHPGDEVDSKKGRTEGEGKSREVQFRIDWVNTGIQKPVLKPNPQHPSFKPDPSGASNSSLPPQMKSLVTTRGSHWQHSYSAGCHSTTPASQVQDNKGDSEVSGYSVTKFQGDLEKREVKEKSYD